MSVYSVLSPVIDAAYHAVTAVSAVLVPILGGFGTAGAIVVFTALVRLGLHPLNRRQVRSQAAAEQARAALAPQVQRLQRKLKSNPQRLQRETLELYRANGVSLLPGILPALLQLPVLTVMYRLFVSPTIGGRPNRLLTAKLFGVGLGSHLRDAATLGHLAVFILLLAAVAAIATWSVRRMSQTMDRALTPDQPAAVNRLMRLLPYGTVLAAAVVPLATGLYLATTTLWTVVERRYLIAGKAVA